MRILSLSGFTPEQICDTIRFSQYAGDRNISHYCGYVSDFISQVVQDKSIDGAVFPKSCDSARTIGSYLSDTGKFLFQIDVPSYGAVGARRYFASVIRSYKRAVEAYFEVKLDDTVERTELVNRRNSVIRKLHENLADISFADYLAALHETLTMPLCEQTKIRPVKKAKIGGKRVYVIGSFLSNLEIAQCLEDVGLSVVGDNLPESGRLATVKTTALDGDIFENIADAILSMNPSPTQNAFRNILETDRFEINNKSAQGIIFITQKYCEPYDYLFSSYKAMADDMGLPILKLSLNDTEDNRKATLSLEAFADTL